MNAATPSKSGRAPRAGKHHGNVGLRARATAVESEPPAVAFALPEVHPPPWHAPQRTADALDPELAAEADRWARQLVRGRRVTHALLGAAAVLGALAIVVGGVIIQSGAGLRAPANLTSRDARVAAARVEGAPPALPQWSMPPPPPLREMLAAAVHVQDTGPAPARAESRAGVERDSSGTAVAPASSRVSAPTPPSVRVRSRPLREALRPVFVPDPSDDP